MKKIFSIIACALALGSCNMKEEVMQPSSEEGEYRISVIASAADIDGKTYLSGENEVLWGTNEQMFLTIINSNKIIGFGYSDPLASEYIGKKEAVFNFKATVSQAASYTYSGVYPASCMNEGNTNPKEVFVTLKTAQNATAASYDPSCYIMVAKPETFTSVHDSWKASFRRAVALNKLTLKNLPEGIRSVTITAPGKILSGKRSIDGTTGLSNAISEGSDSVKVIYTSNLASGTNDIWFTSWKADIAPGETIRIKACTFGKSYTREITVGGDGVKFAEGCLNLLSVDMASATEKDIAPEFTKFEGTKIKPGVKNAIVVNGVFDPANDNVKLSFEGGPLESIGMEYKKIEYNRITIYNSISRVEQNLQFYLIRDGKQYALTDKVRCVTPLVEEGYVPDAKFREAIKTERSAWVDGKEKKGLGAADAFDFCGMLDLDKAAQVKLESGKISIGGWEFASISGFELFSGLGQKAWDEPLIYFYNSSELTEADFSNFNGYLAVGLSNCPKLTKIVLGPNMGGVNGCYNNPKLEVLDISKSSMVTQLMMQYGDTSLKLLDLRYQPSSYKLSSSGNFDLKALKTVTSPTSLVIRLNTDLFVHRSTSTNDGAWAQGIYAAWVKGATVELYEYGNNDHKIGTVPAYTEQPDALSPENSTEKDEKGNWISKNNWPSYDPEKEINGTQIMVGNNLAGLITDETGKEITGVPVSDGYNYCYTDENGVYQMASDPRARYVYYSLPAEYQANLNSNNYPVFYTYIDGADEWNRCDFTLKKKTVDETNWTLVGIGDPQPYQDSHVTRYKNEAMADIVTTLNAQQAAGNFKNAYAVALGDIVSNAPSYYDKIRNSMSNVQLASGRYLPFYMVAGNHDHATAGAMNKIQSEREYVEKIGPLDYSFNIGKAHIVVMDNYVPDESKYTGGYNSNYTCGITDEQLSWLRQDLESVKDKENTLLIYCSHAPFMDGVSNPQANHVIKSNHYSDMLNLFAGFHDCHLLSGHTHFWLNKQITNYVCKSGRPVYEHNQNAPCGWIWGSKAVCADGSPIGYALYDIRGNEVHDWVAKSEGYDFGYQMRVYNGNQKFEDHRGYTFSWYDPSCTIVSDKSYIYPHFQNAFIANIWAAEPDSWKVEFFIDGVKYGDMTWNKDYPGGEYWNPSSCDMLVQSFIPSCPQGSTLFNQARQASHYWYIEAPGGVDPSTVKNWEVRATQTIPGSGVKHVYTCNSLQTDYTGLDAVPTIK